MRLASSHQTSTSKTPSVPAQLVTKATTIASEMSVIIVSHDQRIRDIADRVLWLEDGAFRDIVAMVTDPVCGMPVEQATAVSADRDGERAWFCSRGCRAEFLGTLPADPGDAWNWRALLAGWLRRS